MYSSTHSTLSISNSTRLFGYDQGVMSGIISSDAFTDVFTAAKGDNTMQALITAVYELGCLFGAMFALFTADILGRRKMVIGGAAIMIIGVVIQVTSFVGHIPLLQFFFGRVITGIGNGMNTSTIPTYQAECSRTSNRGLLICIEGGTIAIGTMIAYWIDFGASYGPPDLAWRFPIAFQVVFGAIIIVGMWYLPDSPRFLISKGKVQEGEYVLAALAGKEIDDHETQLQKQLVIESIEAYVFLPHMRNGMKETNILQCWCLRWSWILRPLDRRQDSTPSSHVDRIFISNRPTTVRLQRSHLLSPRPPKAIPQPIRIHVPPYRRCQHDCLRHLRNLLLVLHRKDRSSQAVYRRYDRSNGLHDHRLRLSNPRRNRTRQGSCLRSFPVHGLLRSFHPSSALVVSR